MVIFTTLDWHYRDVWEKDGDAFFKSKYELYNATLLNKEYKKNPIYAIGLYKRFRSEAQKHNPSLLLIKDIDLNYCGKNIDFDIKIKIEFITKLPQKIEILKIQPTPLINFIEDKKVLSILGTKSIEEFIRYHTSLTPSV